MFESFSWSEFLSIKPFSWASIATAVFCGTMIGVERQIRGKPVGIRTSSLIVLGTYLFLASSQVLTGDALDPSRVVGQVITGIGFLGAGVMLSKDGAVVGVTSAAAIWVLAAMGVMIAMGFRLPAIKVSILVVAILWGVDLLEDNTRAMSRGVYSRIRRFRSMSKSKSLLKRQSERSDD